MGDQIVFMYDNKHSQKPHYPLLTLNEPEGNISMMDEMNKSNRELELLFQEAQEYDFLMSKTPQDLPDNWEEEE